MLRSVFFIGLSALGLAACGDTAVPDRQTVVSSRDFVLMPCHEAVTAPCTLAIAGGKRVLLGAPSGAEKAFSNDELQQLDAVILFSLRARDIEGLDSVRNQSWQAGRRMPLLVVGPDGTSAFTDGLNTALETPDALHIVDDGIPQGGFDAALLNGVDVPLSGDWVSAFDTGDLLVEARDMGSGHLHLQLRYQSVVDLVGNCAAWRELHSDAEPPEAPLGCSPEAEPAWPLAEPIWYVRADPAL